MPTEFLLFGALGLLLVFMIFNTRRRTRQMKAEQEEKRAGTVPGAKVLLQGGLYGTIVSYDGEDLDAPALVELAPGTVVEVHSQAILRIVDPVEVPEDASDLTDEEDGDDVEPSSGIETPEETRARLERDGDDK
ncbi:preprotein translocase subunit YajC [Microbacterium sp. NIBRBAC000506063]|uniref:preprotein translocase subunit YajC n=1 Tax=Microbacterium sp. NIBRBAC000506063 TaxID=2734618 RepID=UPI001BB68C15|nr:preprotein translocase subunit YajC [Microbacterium sp. NIBRBAC000506063]QTV79747.1 preprotein translocase subunit YajC [Microbacterium sp. NIBRBAC000506063]